VILAAAGVTQFHITVADWRGQAARVVRAGPFQRFQHVFVADLQTGRDSATVGDRPSSCVSAVLA
jgi:hypothetical protein